jgi:hypothetical protein
VVGKERSDPPLRAGLGRLSRLEPDVVVHCNPELLFAAEISFSRLYGHVPEEELNLIQFADRKLTQTVRTAPEIMGASFSMPHRAAASLTTSHRTFGVIPSPHILPGLLIDRNTRPVVICADSVQESTTLFTQ